MGTQSILLYNNTMYPPSSPQSAPRQALPPVQRINTAMDASIPSSPDISVAGMWIVLLWLLVYLIKNMTDGSVMK